ncbi:hypothetical protein [Sporichthya sp.]|uniref:hypothetical protein n=1 Tax=Sporichthya sp. TaxID=65475 RepID=UPI0018277671|nr:hypothetical protein [Sporichthya sp.]MBA3743187.1 hypothetical protein [Sporichthya sp.]
MSSERDNQRDSVTGSEVRGPGLFDFGPDIEGPATGPQAVLPPWMAEQAKAARAAANEPPAGETLSARFKPVPVAVDVLEDEALESAEDVTPEPVVVPDFARTVPAPRKRRKPVPADRVVIAAPAVVDGSGNVVMDPADADADQLTVTGPAPLVPAQRTDAAAPQSDETTDEPAPRSRRRWVGLTQAAAIVAVGATVGIFAAGGLGFLGNTTEANPPTAEAGAWVLNNLAGAGSVLIPSSMADGLIQNGQDSDTLTTYPDSSAADLDLGKNCCSYLVLSGAPGQEVGSGLPASVHTLFERSRPAAVFTTDGGWTQVRQVLPGSPAKVAKDLEADHAALVATGKSLIASGRVELSDLAKAQVQNGEVDARVLIGVVAVALQHKITIASFPAQPGEAVAGILRRSVAISEIDGKAVKEGSDRAAAVKAVLAGQTGIYRPAGAEVHPVDGANALEVRYDAPSPFGVLTLNDEDGNAS